MKQLAEVAGRPARSAVLGDGPTLARHAVADGILRRGWLLVQLQISPARRDQRARPIRQDQDQMQGAPPMRRAGHPERLPLEGVVLTDDDDALGIPIEVVVGSVSCLPSIGSTTTS